MIKKIFTIIIFITVYSFSYSQMVVGYLPYYRGFNSNYDYSKYTHIHYFSIYPGEDGGFDYPSGMDSVSMAEQFKTIADEACPNDVKMIITFGGISGYGSKNFVSMAANDSARNVFINNVLQLCKNWNADGIDIDWEWEQHTDTETSNYAFTNLMSDLREMTNENNLSLSLDVSASSWNGKYYNPDAVILADYVNVMTYTYNGSWSSTAGHHSALTDAIDIGLLYWKNKGIPKSKLNIGTAFYGMLYEGTYKDGGSFTDVSAITYTKTSSLIASGYEVVEDNLNGTYCYSESENQIVFYDSPKNAAYKMEYAMDNDYAGIIIWEIGQDDYSQSLATAIDNSRKGLSEISVSNNNSPPYKIIKQNGKILFDGLQHSISASLYSLSGNRLAFKLNSNDGTLDVSNLPQGIYLLHVQYNGNTYSEKINL